MIGLNKSKQIFDVFDNIPLTFHEVEKMNKDMQFSTAQAGFCCCYCFGTSLTIQGSVRYLEIVHHLDWPKITF